MYIGEFHIHRSTIHGMMKRWFYFTKNDNWHLNFCKNCSGLFLHSMIAIINRLLICYKSNAVMVDQFQDRIKFAVINM